MYKTHNPALVANAKALRRNMTKEERHLWYSFVTAAADAAEKP